MGSNRDSESKKSGSTDSSEQWVGSKAASDSKRSGSSSSSSSFQSSSDEANIRPDQKAILAQKAKMQAAQAAKNRNAKWQRGFLIAGIVLSVAAVITAVVLSAGMVGIAIAGGAAVTAALGGTAAAAGLVSFLSVAAVASSVVGVLGAVGIGFTAFYSRQMHKFRLSTNKGAAAARFLAEAASKAKEKSRSSSSESETSDKKTELAAERKAVREALALAESERGARDEIAQRAAKEQAEKILRDVQKERDKHNAKLELSVGMTHARIRQTLSEEDTSPDLVSFQVQEGFRWVTIKAEPIETPEAKALESEVKHAVGDAVIKKISELSSACNACLDNAISAIDARNRIGDAKAVTLISNTKEKVEASYKALTEFCENYGEKMPEDLILRKKTYDQSVEAYKKQASAVQKAPKLDDDQLPQDPPGVNRENIPTVEDDLKYRPSGRKPK